MTLEERFREECTIVDGVGIIDAKQCVSITDEFAVNFFLWTMENPNLSFKTTYSTPKEALNNLLAEYKRINNL